MFTFRWHPQRTYKYTHLSRPQDLIADHAEDLLKQDTNRTYIPHWNGSHWVIDNKQQVYSYPPSLYFVNNQANTAVTVLFQNRTITMSARSIRIFDENLNVLWYSAKYSGIRSDNTQLVSVVMGPLAWKTWSEPTVSIIHYQFTQSHRTTSIDQ